MNLQIYNSLTKNKEVFEPLKPPKVYIYTCGPTVYDYVSIGNWRTYTLSDLVVRTLKYLGYSVQYIMNITDVGHLTGDNLGDASTGEDRMEKASKRENKSAWDIAKFYTNDFKKGYKQLNLTQPQKFAKATKHIQEQIELVKKIEQKGLTYKIDDGMYFNVKKWENMGNEYGKLSSLDKIKEGARVKPNPQKKDPRDFALWKFSPKDKQRQMEWPSPWSKGFPGWHIECSAMSMKYLGDQFDIHIGGEDLKNTHHPNEIAQSEAVTGKKPFVKYWIHGAFLRVDGQRMGKSLGNVYNLHDLQKKGFDPLALRYLYLTAHYRKPLNFTWEALENSQKSLNNLRDIVVVPHSAGRPDAVSQKESKALRQFNNRFTKSISDDFNMPEALAVVWEMAKSNLKQTQKIGLLKSWDEVLGLDLEKVSKVSKVPKVSKAPKEVKKLIDKREKLRKQKKWQQADEIRKKIEKMGFKIKDTPHGPKLTPS